MTVVVHFYQTEAVSLKRYMASLFAWALRGDV